jgi:molecular chaperone DnaK (HSP70)
MRGSGAVGLDIGSHSCVIAAYKQQNIEIMLNELTNRSTPSTVGFGPVQRFIGETGRSQLSFNFLNSVSSPSRFLGLPHDYIQASGDLKWLTSPVRCLDSPSLGFEVSYLDQAQVFSPQSLTAMLVGHLQDTVLRQGLEVSHVVIAVPAYYTDPERRAMLDAAQIAGVPCIGLINDTTAAALSYGYNRSEITDHNPKTVAFVDMGHSKLSVAVARLSTNKLQILGKAFARDLGSRDFDWLFARSVAATFEQKHGVDPLKNVKSRLRLLTAVERLRKVLSAGSDGTLHIECLAEDIDLELTVTRADFLGVCADLLNQVREICGQALVLSGSGQVSDVELLGGASRIPAVQAVVAEVFGVAGCSRTLIAEEEVAKGCALQAALLASPQAVHYYVEDIATYSVNALIQGPAEEPVVHQLFAMHDAYLASKSIAVQVQESVCIELVYSTPLTTGLPCKFAVFRVVLARGDQSRSMVLSFTLDSSGLVSLKS